MSKRELLTGNQACLRGAMDAGLNFYAGYPITPATEIAEEASELLPAAGGTYIQMEDELGSICAVIGASVAGACAMTATSGPGFSLMQEAIGYAAAVEIPCVIVDVMRQGPSTGAPTRPSQGDIMQSIFGSHGDYPSVVIVPDSVNELYAETIRAFRLSHDLNTPVTILSDAKLAHMSELVSIQSDVEKVSRRLPQQDKDEYRPYAAEDSGIPAAPCIGGALRWHGTGLIHDDSGFPCTDSPELIQTNIDRLLAKVKNNLASIQSWDERWTDDAEDILIVSLGIASRCAIATAEALRAEGVHIGVFRPITLWPFPAERLDELARRSRHVVCIEMSAGQLELLCRAHIAQSSHIIGMAQTNGCIPEEDNIIARLKEIIDCE